MRFPSSCTDDQGFQPRMKAGACSSVDVIPSFLGCLYQSRCLAVEGVMANLACPFYHTWEELPLSDWP